MKKEKYISNGATALYELAKLLLKLISNEEGVVAKLIASDDDLKKFACFTDKDNPIFKGWRYEIFGKHAKDLRDGKLNISYDTEKRNIKISKQPKIKFPAVSFCAFAY